MTQVIQDPRTLSGLFEMWFPPPVTRIKTEDLNALKQENEDLRIEVNRPTTTSSGNGNSMMFLLMILMMGGLF
jgi:hypothetical protein